MYGHDLIESIRKSHPDCDDKVEIISNIKNSMHFFMGCHEDVFDVVFNESYVGVPYFSGILKQSIIPPYAEMCFQFSVKKSINMDGLTSRDVTKAVYYVNSKDHNDIYFRDFTYHKCEDYWAVPGYKVVINNAKNADIADSGCTVIQTKKQLNMYGKAGMDVTKNMGIVNFSLMLLNTKNITTIDNPPPAKLNKKRIKNGKQPLFTYKTLRLQLPAKKRKKGSGPAKDTDNTTRLHLCRGHFKTYTEDKPLLGKFTGRYWWQPHARGDKAKGVVMKDYEVVV